MSERNNITGLANIAEYIQNLKFKPVLVGGVDKEDVFVSIKEIYRMFSDIHKREVDKVLNLEGEKRKQSEELILRLQKKIARLEEDVDNEKAASASLKEELEKARKEAAKGKGNEPAAAATEKNKTAPVVVPAALPVAAPVSAPVAAPVSAQVAAPVKEIVIDESREKDWENRLKLQTEKYQKDIEAEQQNVSVLRKKLNEKEDEQLSLQRKHKAREEELTQEISKLESKISVMKNEAEVLESEHKKALALATSKVVERDESLEEIYVDARNKRVEIIRKAEEEAKAKILAAEASAEEIRAKSERVLQEARDEAYTVIQQGREEATAAYAETLKEAEEKYQEILRDIEEANLMVEKANEEIEQSKQEAIKVADEINMAAMARLDAAEETLADAREEAKEIVDSAKITYMQECEKYNDLLMKLGEARADTVKTVQETVSRLSNLVFDMTSEGIRQDAINTTKVVKVESNLIDESIQQQ